MKKRLVHCVAGACVAGMVAGVPAVALADQGAESLTSGSVTTAAGQSVASSAVSWSPDIEHSRVLYGPPSVFKKVNPITASAKSQTVSAAKIEAKSKKFTKAITVKKAVGKVSYKRIEKGSSKRLAVNGTNGAITVKKGTKAGTYKIKVRVMAAGNKSYDSGRVDVTVKVRVK